MKAIIISLASVLIIAFSGVSNANTISPKGGDIKKLIQKQVSYPDFAKEQKLEGVVLVDFTLNADGTIKVNTTNQSDINLKDYVVTKLKQIKLKPDTSAAKSYSVKFDFKYVK